MVGKLGQGMKCCKCNSTSNVLVCETQGLSDLVKVSRVSGHELTRELVVVFFPSSLSSASVPSKNDRMV
jgi:hypothetical protein